MSSSQIFKEKLDQMMCETCAARGTLTSMEIKTHDYLHHFGVLCVHRYFELTWCVWASDLSYTSFVAPL